MASQSTVVITIMLDDEASRGLKKVNKSIERTGKEADTAGKKTGKFGGGLSKLKGIAGGASKGIGMLATGLTAGAVAIGVVAAAGAVLVGVTDQLLDAWSEQTRAVGGAQSAMRRAGLEGQALSTELANLNLMAGTLSLETMFGDEDIFNAAAMFTKLTGDATVSIEQMDVILGIAAGTQKEASEAAQLYAKAMKGDIGALKDLTPLTTTQEKELAKLEGTSKQSALAAEILARQYKGLAQEVDPTTLAIKNMSDAFGDAQQSLGGVISSSGVLGPIMDAVTDAFRFVEAAVYDNSVQIQQWIAQAVLTAIDGIADFNQLLIDNSDTIGGVTTVAMLFGKVLNILTSTVMIIAQSIRTVLSTALAGLTEAFAVLMDTGAAAAEFLGDDGMAMSLHQASKGARSMADELAGDALKGVEGIKKEAYAATAQFDEFGDILMGTEERAELARRGLELTRDNIKALREEIELAQRNIKPVTATTVKTGGSGAQAPGDKPADPLKQLTKEAEKTKEVVAVERERIRGSIDMALARQNEARATQLLAFSMADLATSVASVSTGFGELDGISTSITGVAGAQEKLEAASREAASAAGAVALGVEGSAERQRDAVDGVTEAEMARAGAIQATGAAAAGVAGALGANARVEAGIQAAFSAAASVSAFAGFAASGGAAIPLAVAGTQYALSAGMFAAIAGGVGSGSGSGSGGGGRTSAGAGAGSGSPGGLDMGGYARVQAEALADVLEERRGGDVVYEVTIRDSVISSEKGAVDLVENGLRQSSLNRRLTRNV